MRTEHYYWMHGLAMGLAFWIVTVCGVLLAGEFGVI